MKYILVTSLSLCLFFLGNPTDLAAQKTINTPTFQLIAGGAIELGGDRAAWTTDENGDNLQVRGAQGVSLAAGVRFRPAALPKLMVDATIGYKYFGAFGAGESVHMGRVPVHLTAHYFVTKNIRLGVGVLTNRGISVRGAGAGQDGDFDPSVGTKFEIGWRNLALGYTRMNYNRPGDRERCAGGFGLTYLVPLTGKK